MASEFAGSIRESRPARTDGLAAVRVLSVLEAASLSLANKGNATAVKKSAPLAGALR
jgi:hypothetical protein